MSMRLSEEKWEGDTVVREEGKVKLICAMPNCEQYAFAQHM